MSTDANPDAAFEIEQRIREQLGAVRGSWVGLAALLYAFHSERAWTLRSCETFSDWLGQPEIGLSHNYALGLVKAWRMLAVEREVSPDRLQRIDFSKLDVVLPALKRDEVTVEEGLADAETLSRSDLRTKYRGSPKEPEQHLCPDCGQRHSIKVSVT